MKPLCVTAAGAALLTAALLAATPARAGVLTVTTKESGLQSWYSTLELAQFDGRLGQLREVRMLFDVEATHEYLVHNPYTRPIDASISLLSDFSIGSRWSSTRTIMTKSVDVPLAVSDTWVLLTEHQTSSDTVKLQNRLEDFIGTGRWSLWVHSKNDVTPNYWTADVANVMSMTTSTLRLRVDYLYDEPPAPQPQPIDHPLPEPATPALAGLALLAVAWQRRAARRA